VKDVERPSRCGITREFTFLTHDAFKRRNYSPALAGLPNPAVWAAKSTIYAAENLDLAIQVERGE
jgi:hypothetical protein